MIIFCLIGKLSTETVKKMLLLLLITTEVLQSSVFFKAPSFSCCWKTLDESSVSWLGWGWLSSGTTTMPHAQVNIFVAFYICLHWSLTNRYFHPYYNFAWLPLNNWCIKWIPTFVDKISEGGNRVTWSLNWVQYATRRK